MTNSQESGTDKTLWCGNLGESITEELLYELFLQAGPLESVKIPSDREGRKRNFSFIVFKHAVSVPYALKLFSGVRLQGRPLNLQFRPGSVHSTPPRSAGGTSVSPFPMCPANISPFASPALDDRGLPLFNGPNFLTPPPMGPLQMGSPLPMQALSSPNLNSEERKTGGSLHRSRSNPKMNYSQEDQGGHEGSWGQKQHNWGQKNPRGHHQHGNRDRSRSRDQEDRRRGHHSGDGRSRDHHQSSSQDRGYQRNAPSNWKSPNHEDDRRNSQGSHNRKPSKTPPWQRPY